MTFLRDHLGTDYGDVQFEVQRSARYNSARQKHYEFLAGITSFSIIALTGISGYVFIEQSGWIRFILPAVVILISTLDLIYKPSKMAAVHKILTRHFIRLDVKMTLSEDKTSSAAEQFLAERLEIDQDSPPDSEVANIISHNELCDALGSTEEIYHVNWFRRLLSQWKSLPPKEWVKLDDFNARKENSSNDSFQQAPA